MFIILLDPTEYFTFFISVLSDDHISVAQLSQIYVTRQFQSCTWPVNLTVKKLQHIGSCIWKLHCLNFTRYIHITYYILHITYILFYFLRGQHPQWKFKQNKQDNQRRITQTSVMKSQPTVSMCSTKDEHKLSHPAKTWSSTAQIGRFSFIWHFLWDY